MTVSGRGKLVKLVVDTTTRDCWPAQVPAPRAVRGAGPPPAAAAPYELAEWRDAGVNMTTTSPSTTTTTASPINSWSVRNLNALPPALPHRVRPSPCPPPHLRGATPPLGAADTAFPTAHRPPGRPCASGCWTAAATLGAYRRPQGPTSDASRFGAALPWLCVGAGDLE